MSVPFYNIAQNICSYVKRKIMDNFVCPLESECAKRLKLHSQAIPETWAPFQYIKTRTQFNIKMTSYQYRKPHIGNKTILRPSDLHNGISYTGKTSLYWIGAQTVFTRIWDPFINMRLPLVIPSYLCNGNSCTGIGVKWHLLIIKCPLGQNFIMKWDL